MVRYLAWFFGAVSLLSLTGCDAYDEYTIENNTDQDLLTWPSFYGCDEPRGPYTLHEVEGVPAGGVHGYAFSWGGPGFSDGPKCVVVTTLDRRAVLLAEYKYGATYSVEPPVVPGAILPAEGDLNQGNIFKAASEGKIPAIFWLVVLLGFVVGFVLPLPIALFIAGRYLWRYYRRGKVA